MDNGPDNPLGGGTTRGPQEESRNMHRGKSITIPVDCQLAAGLLWLVSAGLMIADLMGGAADLGRASVLVSIIAATVTINALVAHHRRVVLEVMNYEFRLRDGEPEGDLPLASGYVMPSQRPRLLAMTQRTRVD